MLGDGWIFVVAQAGTYPTFGINKGHDTRGDNRPGSPTESTDVRITDTDTNAVRVLDCTLRDGGYYNEWNFSPSLVDKYLESIVAAGVNIIEIGFRFFQKNRFVGPNGFCTEQYLATLPLPKHVRLAVMVNAGDLVDRSPSPTAAVDELFADRTDSPIEIVRIATHYSGLAEAKSLAVRLKEKGYTVCLNLMQVSMRSRDELIDAVRIIDEWNAVDVFYLADSVGSLDPGAFGDAVHCVRNAWSGSVGVHAHNNKGLALQNSLAAITEGATWIDGTILGMGRGAGNAQTEYLLLELNERGRMDFVPEQLFPLVMDDFDLLHQRYQWGPSLLYYLSGRYGIHPTYVQEMVGHRRHDAHDLIAALGVLAKSGAPSFDASRLERAMLGEPTTATGTWSARDWAAGRKLLMIGPGPGTADHLPAILEFIRRTNPVTVCLNVNDNFPVEHLTAYAACHRTRLLLDAGRYVDLSKPLVAPRAAVPDAIQTQFGNLDVLDYGMEVQTDTFSVESHGCVIPVQLVAAYVMALAEAASATGILLAGFDGYDDPSNPRQQEMEHVLQCYQARPTAPPLLAVTPSSYDLPKGSIYSPTL